ncbi:MAG: hypothetical protein LJE84_09290 [Gammaproteobacteria bacterium]|nr:hypothetical protein [Gammaproteobacteria bacterium]
MKKPSSARIENAVDSHRRASVRRLLAAGFVAPIVVTMAASSLPIRSAHAQSLQPDGG